MLTDEVFDQLLPVGAVHKPVGLTRIEALVALRRAAQGW